ncbi:dipeptide ABC transporter ATP-binding protein [Rhodococcoides yunnanense]|uniref:dipeptide ABC transporter ATP-binding protein n=1 Tax=Rhodococcoides yunnanense TaxID=278209 RepID=UPI000933E0EA|nr:ABC transporter ATP-binding protein [Rhodococcus yunnanensis]
MSTINAPHTPYTVPSPVVEIEDLSVEYRSSRHSATPTLHGVSLHIDPGEIVAVVGESGSGKTTLSRAVIGLLPKTGRVTGGSIRLAGRELTTLSKRELADVLGREIALVPQDPATALNPVLTIGKQVSEVFRLHRRALGIDAAEIRRRSLDLLELVGIDRPSVRFDQYPHELSGGMRQRVLIAIAFGLRPSLLIADEPTSALDVTVQRQVLDVLDDLAREFSVAVLFVTHNLAVATDRASRVVVMRGGHIVEQGDVADIARAPQDPYTAELLREAFAFSVLGGGRSRSEQRAGSSATPAITVRGVRKTFQTPTGKGKAILAVDDVSFTVAAGSTFALVGESGSGKSTTAGLIMGLQSANDGSISVLGHEVVGATSRRRRELWRNIQLVYQNPRAALDPRWSIREIVGEPLRSYGIADRARRPARIADVLDRVGLPTSVLTRRPGELSGGQQQRVAIARALVVDPEIIVLDEALSALDVVTQAQVLALLERLQHEQGLTYLFISHDLAVVRAISDSVAVMRAGKIVEQGTVEDVFDDPQHSYTQNLIESVPGNRFAQLPVTVRNW